MNFQSGEAPHSNPPPATARLRPKRGRKTTENPRLLGIKKGFTLVEVVIAMSLFSLLLLLAFSGIISMMNTYADNTNESVLEQQAETLSEQLQEDFLDAGLSTLVPANPTQATSLTFQKNIGFQNNSIVWSAPITYTYQPMPGEVFDGKDNNNDGLVDEGEVVRTENGVSTVVAVNLQQFSISREGDTLVFTVAFQGLDEKHISVITRTLVAEVRPRNK